MAMVLMLLRVLACLKIIFIGMWALAEIGLNLTGSRVCLVCGTGILQSRLHLTVF